MENPKYKASICEGFNLFSPNKKFWSLEIIEAGVLRTEQTPVFSRQYKTPGGAKRASLRELEKLNKTEHAKWLEKYSMNLKKWRDENPKDFMGKGLGAKEFNEAHLDWSTRQHEAISEWTRENPSPPLTPGEQAELDAMQGFIDNIFDQEKQ